MPPRLCGPEQAAPELFKLIGDAKNAEAIWVFLLDHRQRVVGKKRLAVGESGQVPVSHSAIFREALSSRKPVGGIILAHNHTVSDPRPSQPDLDTTHTAVTLGHLLGIPVLDHIVFGNSGEYASVREYVESRYGENAFSRTLIVPSERLRLASGSDVT